MMEIRRYQPLSGKVPVSEWLGGMRDLRARAQIEIRLKRLAIGNFGDCKSVGEGVLELRIDVGAGYRLYCARHGEMLMVLLCGGQKGSQQEDIKRAKDYWADWKRRNS